MMIRPISDEMKFLADLIGGLRHLINRRNGTVPSSSYAGAKRDLEINQIGMLGELIFAEWKNVWPDLSLHRRSGSPDMIIDGERWDIKTTTHPQGRLTTPLEVNPDVDVYALAIIVDDKMWLPGYARAAELIRPECIGELRHGNGKSYIMQQKNLHRFDEPRRLAAVRHHPGLFDPLP